MNDAALVTGACGFIGRHLTKALVRRGTRVRALVADEASARAARAMGAEAVRGDLSDQGSLRSAVAGVRRVYHLAAQVRPLKSVYSFNGLSNIRREVNVAGTLNLASACRGRIREFMHFSSVAAVGAGPDLDENSPCRPSTDYGKSKREAEIALLELFRRDRFPVKIVRPGHVYGPGNLAMLMFFKLIKLGIRPFLGNGENHIPLCYIDDLIRMCFLIEAKGSVGDIYFAVNAPVTFRQFAGSIAKAMGREMPARGLPAWAFKAGACVKDHAERALRLRLYPFRVECGADAVALASSDWVCRNHKIRGLGFASAMELAQGVDRTLRWYNDNRLL